MRDWAGIAPFMGIWVHAQFCPDESLMMVYTGEKLGDKYFPECTKINNLKWYKNSPLTTHFQRPVRGGSFTPKSPR
ncbi:hypothetical protein, partial [Thiolapillus sp.]|uniref:hypothetical protein n=1 Tax=Thiolapillus sp. TaxID=2017437 RepID=UPI003AF8FB68